MLLSEEKNFLFIHIPKTGGTSVARALQPWALQPPQTLFNKVLSRAGLRRDWKRILYRVHGSLAYAQQRLPTQVYADMYKFAFVRNPWARLVSEYSYVKNQPDHRRFREVRALPDFAAYLRYERARDRRDQVRLVTDLKGQVGVDFLGHMEHLQEDFGRVCTHLGIEASLPHLNKTQHKDYRDFYDSACRDFVATEWRNEVEAFGYEF